jgi:hypothetical protein
MTIDDQNPALDELRRGERIGGPLSPARTAPPIFPISGTPVVGDTLIWNGTLWVPAAPSVLVVTVPITANEIKALHTTPKQLIAAPGVGKFLFPQRILFDFTPGAVPYTNPNGSSFYAIYGTPPDTGSNRVTYYDAATLTNAGRTISPEPVALVDYAASVVLNKAINFTLDQAVLLGDGTLAVTVVYLVI